MKQHVTNLHFFFHDIAGDDNPTVVLVAAPKSLISLVKEPSFGSVYAIDDPLTEGSEGDSTTTGARRASTFRRGRPRRCWFSRRTSASPRVRTTAAPSACSRGTR
ncbi:hypothetical protein B296_00052215 [Ensete ventricosum]|uniref:Dirigent protein n=1 Tax=Ensete ventricosum TaxID=4639 RepID=A0A426YD62_ENSVE|nr:hypothetical protein B296_00052215 [Ensete ventricosum]